LRSREFFFICKISTQLKALIAFAPHFAPELVSCVI